jgi:hypothetical protein
MSRLLSACRPLATLCSTALLTIVLGAGACPPPMTDAGVDAGDGDGDGDSNDRDGDGLTNEEEEQGYTIFIDTSGFGIDSQATLEERMVTSDPDVADTDGDGLDDFEESQNRTDPRDDDTDGDGLTDTEEVQRWRSSPVSVDSDGDATALGAAPIAALFDRAELNLIEDPDNRPDTYPGPLATSPTLVDTDGDGVSDAAELDEPTRSPVVANLPSIDIELTQDPDIRLNVTYEEAEAVEQSFGTAISRETSTEFSRSDSTSTTLSAELSVTVGVEVSAGLPPGASASASTTATAGIERTTGTEVSQTTASAFAQEQSRERTNAQEFSVATESGRISVPVRFENDGTIAYKLADVAVIVSKYDALSQTRRPLTTLTLPAGFDNGIVLAQGAQSAEIPFEADDLNVDLVRDFLRNPSALFFEPTNINLVNEDDTSFVFLTEDTFGRTALVIIDDGQGEPERYRVATNVDRDPDGNLIGARLGQALEDANVDFTLADSTIGREIISAIDDNEATVHEGTAPDLGDPAGDPGPRTAEKFWVLFGARPDGEMALDVDVSDIRLQNRDEVRIVFVQDADRDGVFDREEFLYGARDDTLHSDGTLMDPTGDDLSDFFEIKVGWEVVVDDQVGYPVYPSPLLVDSDGDGLEDREEYDAGSDPWLSDTDFDGLSDADEVANGTDPTAFTNTAPTVTIDSAPILLNQVTLNASTTDAENNITTVTIDWGDSSDDTVIEQDVDNPIDLSSISEVHTYAGAGDFTITVTVVDLGDETDSDTAMVTSTVFPQNPVVELDFDMNTTNTGSGPDSSARNISYATDRFGFGDRAGDTYSMGNADEGGIITFQNLNLGSTFTYSMWINLRQGQSYSVMGQGNGVGLFFNSYVATFAPAQGSNPDDEDVQTTVQQDTWTHLAGVVNGDEVSLYKDGVFVDGKTYMNLLTQDTNCQFWLGTAPRNNFCTDDTPNEFTNLNALLDDVRVFDRALSELEVIALSQEQ